MLDLGFESYHRHLVGNIPKSYALGLPQILNGSLLFGDGITYPAVKVWSTKLISPLSATINLTSFILLSKRITHHHSFFFSPPSPLFSSAATTLNNLSSLATRMLLSCLILLNFQCYNSKNDWFKALKCCGSKSRRGFSFSPLSLP